MTLTNPSPNFDTRAPSLALSYIVLHYTGMPTADAALKRLCDPAAKVSAHYMIDEDGTLYQLVDEDKRAWHAGKSAWRGITDLNSASVGIELVNPGHQFGYRPFPSSQIDALLELLQGCVTRHHLVSRDCVLAHADIAPERKEDPGELFPWQRIADAGFGRWPSPLADDYAPATDADVQQLLRTIGYPCSATNAYDRETRAALVAFQRRYEPNNLTGTPERETVARLRALCRDTRVATS